MPQEQPKKRQKDKNKKQKIKKKKMQILMNDLFVGPSLPTYEIEVSCDLIFSTLTSYKFKQLTTHA